MRGRLFEDLVVSAPPAGRFVRRAALFPLSIAAHAAALATALLFPVVTPAELPSPPMPGPIIDWGPAPPTPPPVAATPAPPRIAKTVTPRDSTRPVIADPLAPAPAPGPLVSMIEPSEVLPEDGHPPCLLNCDGASRDGRGNGPPGPPDAAGIRDGTGTGPIRPGGDIKPPVRIVYVAPVYPDIARAAGIGAVVILECTIDPTGHVADARVIGGHTLLNEAALAAVRQWRYTPTRLNGVPVPVLMTVTVRFTVHR